MTPEEFAKKMEAVMGDTDHDEDYMSAQMDELMEEALIECGYREGITIMKEWRHQMF